MTIVKEANADAEIENVVLLNEKEIFFSDETLYFCEEATFWRLFSKKKPKELLSFVMLRKEGKKEKAGDEALITARLSFCGNLICVDTEEDFYAAYRTVTEQMQLRDYMVKAIKKLSRLVFSNMDLFSTANQIAEVFRKPVNIVDAAFSVIAFSTNYQYPIKDLEETDLQLHRQIPTSALEELDIRHLRDGDNQYATLTLSHSQGLFRHYQTPIYVNEVLIGYYSVFVLPDEEIPPLMIRYMQPIAGIISLMMQKNDDYQLSKDSYYSALFQSFLRNSLWDENEATQRITLFGYNLCPIKYIFEVKIGHGGFSKAEAQSVCEMFQRALVNSIYYVQEDSFIFFGSYNDTSVYADLLLENCRNIIKQNPNMQIGISAAFQSLSDIGYYAKQAHNAIIAGSAMAPEQKIYEYDALRIPHMVCLLQEELEELDFVTPQLDTLMAYDREHGTELLHTLHCKIMHPQNVAAACEELNIHRNTFYFRIEKIEQLTGLRVNEVPVTVSLYLSFLYMKMKGMIDEPM